MDIKVKTFVEIEVDHVPNHQDPFHEIKEQSHIGEILSKRIPRSTHIYNMAVTYHKFMEEMSFYTFGKVDPWILAIYKRDDSKTQYCISMPQNFTSIPLDVKKAFQTTKRIDWGNYYEFMALDPPIARLITEISLYEKKNPITIYPCNYYYASRDEVSGIKVGDLPSGYEIKPLESEEGAKILSIGYQNTSEATITYLKKTIIRNNYALGIFHNDEPVCRVCLATTGHIGILWTKEEHRRKGLSRICLQKIMKNIVEDNSLNLIPCAMADIKNIASNQTQLKAGFKYSHYNEFIIYEGNTF